MNKYKIGDHVKLNIPKLLTYIEDPQIEILANSICTITDISSYYSYINSKNVSTYKIKEYTNWIPEEGVLGVVSENNGTPKYQVGQSVIVDLGNLLDTDLKESVKKLQGKTVKIAAYCCCGKSYEYMVNNSTFWLIEEYLLPISSYATPEKEVRLSLVKIPTIIPLNFNC